MHGFKRQVANVIFTIFAVGLPLQASASPVFSTSATVTTVDRMATFTGINGSLVAYTEDNLVVSAPGSECCFANVHYASGGNNDYVRITGTDNAVFSAMDFVLGNGQGGSLTNVRWETYLLGALTGSGLASGVTKGIVVGWSDVAGFDEVRVAAAISEALPGFGNHQSVSLDNLRAQLSAVPEPATLVLFGLGLMGLGFGRRRKA